MYNYRAQCYKLFLTISLTKITFYTFPKALEKTLKEKKFFSFNRS